jgi:hypothetical protein
MASDPSTPILFGTEKDYAWDAYQKGYGDGKLSPDRERFKKYFDEVYLQLGAFSLQDRMRSAWNVGVRDRNEDATAGYDAWWQEILDSQPVLETTKGK